MSAKAAFQTTHGNTTHLGTGLQVVYVLSPRNWYADDLYLSDEFLLFGRLGHVVDLLVQLSEGRFGVTRSLR